MNVGEVWYAFFCQLGIMRKSAGTEELHRKGEGMPSRTGNKKTGEMVADRVVVVVSGEGVDVSSIQPRAALELAAAYLDLLEKVAEEHEQKLELHGIELVAGSVGIAVCSATPQVAEVAAKEVDDLRQGCAETASTKVERALNRLNRSIEDLPEGYYANVIAGPWKGTLVPAREVAVPTEYWSATTLRAVPIRVGGKIPRIWLLSDSEDRPFTVLTDRATARAVAHHLYDEVEVSFRFVRDEDGSIRDGQLEEFLPVEATPDEVERWRIWFREGASRWKDVEDVDGELGRGGAHQ